jgi:hypothetical protein
MAHLDVKKVGRIPDGGASCSEQGSNRLRKVPDFVVSSSPD